MDSVPLQAWSNLYFKNITSVFSGKQGWRQGAGDSLRGRQWEPEAAKGLQGEEKRGEAGSRDKVNRGLQEKGCPG